MGLAALVMVSVSLLQPGSTQAMARSPVRLLANAVGDIHLGTSQTTAIKELSGTFGKLKTVRFKAIDWCGLTAQSTRPNVLFNFERGKFVGYEIGNWSGKTAGQPDVVTGAGLRIGGTIAQAKRIYGRQFITSAAQGGSWKVQTPSGEMVGLLDGPPMSGSTDQVDLIGAGYFGCPAMSP